MHPRLSCFYGALSTKLGCDGGHGPVGLLCGQQSPDQKHPDDEVFVEWYCQQHDGLQRQMDGHTYSAHLQELFFMMDSTHMHPHIPNSAHLHTGPTHEVPE